MSKATGRASLLALVLGLAASCGPGCEEPTAAESGPMPHPDGAVDGGTADVAANDARTRDATAGDVGLSDGAAGDAAADGGAGGNDSGTSNNYPGDLSSKFAEQEVLLVDDLSELYGHFALDHYTILTGTLPACIDFDTGTATIRDKCGIVVSNPLVQSEFYKIEVEIGDANQQNLTALMNGIDVLWSHSTPTHGLSAGIDTTRTLTSYWHNHTQLSTAGLSQEQIDFSSAAQSRFVARRQGDILVEMYVTPIGTYVVIDGANYLTFPNLYTGSMVYNQQLNPINYLVLGKWNSGGDPVTFKNLRFIRLDPQIQSVHEVNAYFLKRTIESDYFQQAVADSATPYADNLWLAFIFRGYDYYFRTHHQAQVQALVDRYIAGLSSHIDNWLPRYGQTSTTGINHEFINGSQAQPYVVYALSAYLTPSQKWAIRQQFARVIDTTMSYIRTDGECHFETHNYLPNGTGQYDEEVTYQGVRYRWYWDSSHNHPVAEQPLDLTQIPRYVGTVDQPGPCYNKGAGQCRLSTRTYYAYTDGSGQTGESITAYNRAYNYYSDGAPWPDPAFGFFLYDVDRYQNGPCLGRSQNDCDFETRTYVTLANGDLVESITAYGKVYNFTYDAGTDTWDPWPTNGDDLTSVPQYTGAYGPCAGRAAGDCHLDTRDWRPDPDGDTITANGNIYRFSAGEVPRPGYNNLSFCEWFADGCVACRYRSGPCRFIFPESDGYIGDTFAEEIGWLLAYYTGYLVHFPEDHPRADRLKEYLTFLGFHHMSDGKSIRQVYGNAVQFSYLGPEYLDFKSRYMWDDGSIDNHNFHPSLNYALGVVGQAAVVRNALAKNQIFVSTITNNLERAYAANIIGRLDIRRFKHLAYVPRLDWSTWTFEVQQDSYSYADPGSISDFMGMTKPSLLEDWGSAFTSYHVIENYGDYDLALAYARNVYYGTYTGTGKLFCDHSGPCSVSTNSFWNFTFGNALYALLFSMQSDFDPRRP